ncbi:Os07g0104366, partial [Oryza sativa Japonica Group]
QPVGVRAVELERRVGAGAVEAVGEVWAVRLPEGVGGGEHDEVLDVEALGGEGVHHAGDVAAERGKLTAAAGGGGGAAVPAAERDVPVGALGEDDGVAGHEGEEVGAGDGGRAGGLELGLDAGDGVEATEGLVGVGVPLGGVGAGGVEEDGGVAALDEAVVVVEAEQRGGEVGGRTDDPRRLPEHHLLCVRARLPVVPRPQLPRCRCRWS